MDVTSDKRAFSSRSRIFPRTVNSARVSVSQNVTCTVTSRTFSKWGKVYVAFVWVRFVQLLWLRFGVKWLWFILHQITLFHYFNSQLQIIHYVKDCFISTFVWPYNAPNSYYTYITNAEITSLFVVRITWRVFVLGEASKELPNGNKKHGDETY